MTPLRYFDTHSHQNDPVFDADREEVFGRMKDASVGAIMVGTDKEMSQRAMDCAETYPNVWATIGQHPTDKHDEKFDEHWYREAMKHPKVVGIGECGLDYYRMRIDTKEERKRQRDLFLVQLQMSIDGGKPLMIHCRDAHDELIDILTLYKKEAGDRLKGNIHFYSADWATAKRYFTLDFTLSFTGVLTFARDYDEVVRFSPIDRIMAETDCPYVTPAPFRGKRNESSHVPLVVRKIADIRGEEEEIVAQKLMENVIHRWGVKIA
jgi:TatD DNase family protein